MTGTNREMGGLERCSLEDGLIYPGTGRTRPLRSRRRRFTIAVVASALIFTATCAHHMGFAALRLQPSSAAVDSNEVRALLSAGPPPRDSRPVLWTPARAAANEKAGAASVETDAAPPASTTTPRSYAGQGIPPSAAPDDPRLAAAAPMAARQRQSQAPEQEASSAGATPTISAAASFAAAVKAAPAAAARWDPRQQHRLLMRNPFDHHSPKDPLYQVGLVAGSPPGRMCSMYGLMLLAPTTHRRPSTSTRHRAIPCTGISEHPPTCRL